MLLKDLKDGNGELDKDQERHDYEEEEQKDSKSYAQVGKDYTMNRVDVYNLEPRTLYYI